MAKNIFLPAVFILLSSSFVFGQYNPLKMTDDSEFRFSQKVFPSAEIENDFHPKKVEVAFILSTSVPLVSFFTGKSLLQNDIDIPGAILVVGGIIIGPSAGNMYAKNHKAVGKGIGMRLLGGGMLTVGTYMGLLEHLERQPQGGVRNDMDELSEITAAVLFLSGAALILYSTIQDLFNSMENVRKYNQRNESQKFTLTPTYFPKEKAPGISVSLSF